MAFNRDNRSGGRGGFERRSFDGGRGSDRQMFKTTCSNCGKECEVPFKPTGSKPVYCNDCFRTMGGASSSRSDDRGPRRPSFDSRSDRREAGSSQPQNKEQFEALNAKLDKILKLLSPQTPTKEPVVVTEPVKKKTKSPKSAPTEDIVEAPVVSETPVESDIPAETSTE